MAESTDPRIRVPLTIPECKAAAYACEFSLEVFADQRVAEVSESALGVAHQKLVAALERAGA